MYEEPIRFRDVLSIAVYGVPFDSLSDCEKTAIHNLAVSLKQKGYDKLQVV